MKKRSIKGKIRSIIRNHDRIDYIYCCLKKRNDLCTQEYICDKSFNTITYENIEKRNSDNKESLYYIKSGNCFSGFGAEFRRTLDALFFADYYNLKPVVEYNKKYIYAENKAVNGYDNPFEYYFEQTSNINIEHIDSYKYVLFKEEHRGLAKYLFDSESAYEQSEEYIKEIGRIVNKYIRLNPIADRYITDSWHDINGNSSRVIGVHYRGTDYGVGYKGHPNVVGIQEYFDALDKIICNTENELKIFVATDEEKVIKDFVNRYGEKIIYFKDTFRSNDGAPIHFSENKRDLHKYKLGLEILRDIIALSKCDYLVAGLSQVSYCARFFKYSRNETYEKKTILSNGVK